MWEVGVPKVGTPSSHDMSLGPLFIWMSHMANYYDFGLKLERRDMKIIKKILKKIWEKDKRKLSGKSCKKGGEKFSKSC